MRYRLLGALEVESDDGRPVRIAAPKRRALLAALLLAGDRPSSADRLIESLWGVDPPPAAIESLQAHISRLRGELGPGHLLTVPAGYRMKLGDGDLDIRAFERSLAEGRDAVRSTRWPDASRILGEALELWRGPALADFTFEPFAQSEITRLEELRLSALEDRIDADLALGRHAALTAELGSLVAAEPSRERLWGQLMLALFRSGRQADALAAYRRLRAGLVEDLGIDPSSAITDLQIRILRQDPTLAGPPSGPTQAAIRLPLALTSLVGRRTQLEQATTILRSHRLLTLTGPGGVGKTRLGVMVAYALLADHRDGVLFVDLSAVRDPLLVMATIGEVTGGGERPAEVIGDRQMLLVIDNFEQVLAAAGEIAVLLAQCANLRILVTSRAPLRVGGERQLEVPPLTASDGARLFEERARAALSAMDFEASLVDDIVARLDGLPLAIELAAARIRLLSPEALLERLGARLALLGGGPRDAPERHRTLRETIEWSYELLAPSSRAAFRKLSVFGGGFDLPAALAVAEIDIDCLAELIDQSLVTRAGERYSMLETIREFAAAEADAHSETATARDRHLAHILERASETSRGMTDGGPMGGNPWVRLRAAERENFRLAFDWAVKREDDDAIDRLFRSIGMYWLMVGAIDEGLRCGAIAIDAARRLGDERLMKTLMVASEFPRFGGDRERAIELKLQAAGLARARGNLPELATVLDDLGWTYGRLGDFDRAGQCLAEALAIHDRSPDGEPLDRGHTLGSLAEVALMEGRVADAEACVAEIDRLEEGADPWPDWIVETNWLRATTLHAAGRDREAKARFRDVVRDSADLGFRMILVDALDALAAIDRDADAVGAARLLGMADRLRAEARTGTWDTVEREGTIEMVAATLGRDEYRRCHSEGHAMNLPAIAQAIGTPP
ncbi:MAG: BTAD domain-containing putative transcriptional regulator [Chloroflexota bacterium]